MQSLFLKTALWLVLELFLSSVGLDDLADYSEYLAKAKEFLPSFQTTLTQYQCFNGVCTPQNSLF